MFFTAHSKLCLTTAIYNIKRVKLYTKYNHQWSVMILLLYIVQDIYYSRLKRKQRYTVINILPDYVHMV